MLRSARAEASRLRSAQWRKDNPEKVKAHLDKLNADNVGILLTCAKARAKRKDIEFSIVREDIVIPDVCPVLGIKLKRGEGRMCDSSPTVDRIDSSKGYTKDNICIVSWRANKLKGDATIEELRTVIRYMEKYNGEGP